MAEKLSDMLVRQKEIEDNLKNLGVPEKALPAVMTYLEEYNELQNGLEQARGQQFANDAYEMLSNMNAASNKNCATLTRTLRSFAEHIVSFVVEHYDEQTTAENLVDRIPPLYEDDEE